MTRIQLGRSNLGSERRTFHRFPANSDLQVHLHRRGLRAVLSRMPEHRLVNFSRSGLEIATDVEAFRLGEHLVVDLELADVCAQELPTVVVSRRMSASGGYRYGLRFCQERRHMQASNICHCLRRIEQRLQMDVTYG